jgi:hypothetical protein
MIDREAFLKPRLAEREVDLPGVGTILVRGLSREEVVAMQPLKNDTAALEQRIIELGLVNPALSAADVGAWYAAASTGEVDLIVDAICDLSGVSTGGPKSGLLGLPAGQ